MTKTRKTKQSPVAQQMTHTPNGYDPLWVEAINHVLDDRESGFTISDIDESIWDMYLGPMVDMIEDRQRGDSAEEEEL